MTAQSEPPAATPRAASGRRQGRQVLLDLAEVLFADHGFDAVSTKQLARAAGLTIGALYHHFDSKDEIYRHAVRASFAKLPSVPQALFAEDGDPEERLIRLIRWFGTVITADTPAASLLRRELLDPHLGVGLTELEVFREPQRQFRALLKQIAPSADPDLAVATVVSLSFGLISLSGLHAIVPVAQSMARDTDELAHYISRIVLRGIR